MFAVIGSLVMISNHYTLNGIKSRTVGDGQYGTARFATEKEIRETYAHVPYEPEQWRAGKHLPKEQGLVVGYKKKGNSITALVDSGDIHCLMIGAAGVGKTANFLYPNIEYACASGMSFLTTDTKGDLFRNYAGIAKEYYGYRISILDLRNPTRSDGNNILTLVNKYMDEYLKNPENLAAKARAEKYAKITAKTIICSEGASASSYGQNAFFYDAAEGEVRIKGKDVKQYEMEDLRSRIGVVPQKAVLFKGTIEENIRWGKADASLTEIKEALAAAQALEFVEKKEGKLAYHIEQNGRNLSGGQKQRLTLAVSDWIDTPVLILDEPTSGLISKYDENIGAFESSGAKRKDHFNHYPRL